MHRFYWLPKLSRAAKVFFSHGDLEPPKTRKINLLRTGHAFLVYVYLDLFPLILLPYSRSATGLKNAIDFVAKHQFAEVPLRAL